MPWMPEVFTAPIAEARRVQEEGEATGTNDAVPCYEGSYNGTGGYAQCLERVILGVSGRGYAGSWIWTSENLPSPTLDE